jgi:hypothetical protein
MLIPSLTMTVEHCGSAINAPMPFDVGFVAMRWSVCTSALGHKRALASDRCQATNMAAGCRFQKL